MRSLLQCCGTAAVVGINARAFLINGDNVRELKYKVQHIGCRDRCAFGSICMYCACDVDNLGRMSILVYDRDDRINRVVGSYRMRVNREIYWKCDNCRHSGRFQRLDKQALNYIGCDGVPAFTLLNTAV